MTPKEISRIGKYPVLVKLKREFDELIEESFDSETILEILDVQIDRWNVAEMSAKAPKEFMQYNEKVAKRDWYDKNGNPTLNIYEAFPERFKDGEFYQSIWMMADDDLLEPMTDDYVLDAVVDISTSLGQVTRPLLESMCKKYPNDQDLGREIRKLVNKD